MRPHLLILLVYLISPVKPACLVGCCHFLYRDFSVCEDMTCCTGHERMKFDFFDRVRRILTKQDMPYIVSWFVPEHFVINPSEVWKFAAPGDQADLLERIAIYVLLLENKSGVNDSELNFLSDSLKILDVNLALGRVEIPLFFLLARLLERVDQREINFRDDMSRKLTEKIFIEPGLADRWLGDLSPRGLRDLDARRLPQVIHHFCECTPFSGSRCECKISQSANASETSKGYFAVLPKSRDLAAELNRIQGPFILTTGMTSIVDTWGFIANSDQNEVVFVEVGAHYGDAALFACELFLRSPGKKPRIVAFEPNSAVFDYLTASISLNRFDEYIDARNIALSYTAGQGVFEPVESSSVHSTLKGKSPFTFNSDEFKQMVVTVSTLDMELPSKLMIDLLMIHTNGAELDVLYGGSEILRRTKMVKIRFYAKTPFEYKDKTFVGESKRIELLRFLAACGCGDIFWPEGGTNDEEPLLAKCRCSFFV